MESTRSDTPNKQCRRLGTYKRDRENDREDDKAAKAKEKGMGKDEAR